MKQYKCLYFDLDRTLWDFEKNSQITLSEIFYNFKLNEHFSSFDVFFKTYHRINEKLWDLYRDGKIKKEQLRNDRFLLTLKTVDLKDKKLSVKIGDYYINESPLKTELFPHTLEILEYLKSKNYKLLILTNGFKEVQTKKLNNCKIDKYFDKLICSEDIGYQKPRPEVFHYALSSMNAKKTESIMIGDDLKNDVYGAHNYGIDSVFFNPKQKNAEYPLYQIFSLLELKNIL